MYIDKDEYTKHINDSANKIKIRNILDKIEIVLNKHIIQSTDFLNPYEIHLARSVLNRFMDLKYSVLGGYNESEREIIIIYPEYIFEEDVDISLCPLKIKGDLKTVTHKDYLGSILSLGIKRNKIGDILIYEDHCIVIVKEEISNYLIYNLEKVKNKSVEVLSHTFDNIIVPQIVYKEIKGFLVSLRLDSIISNAFNLSRKESMNIIKAGNIKVNFEPIEKSSREVQEGDLISVKGFGRFILHEIKGKSKSGRFICVIRIIL